MSRNYDPFEDSEAMRENIKRLMHDDDESYRGRRPSGAESEEKKTQEHAAMLLDVYGIKAGMSLKARVRRLYTQYAHESADEILETLALKTPEDREKIERYIRDIEAEIEKAGREQSESDKIRHRGKTIIGLRATVSTLEEMLLTTSDPTKATSLSRSISSINQQILALQGADKKHEGGSEGETDPMGLLALKIAELPTDRIAYLRERLAA